LLHIAASKGHLDIVKYLVENGADINVKNSGQQTPLHYSCFEGHLSVVEYLISKGIEVNSRGLGSVICYLIGHLSTMQ